MSKRILHVDFYHAGKSMQDEISYALGPDSPVVLQRIAKAHFPTGVPDLIDCIIVSLEIFEAVLLSNLKWHPTYRSPWDDIDLAYNRFNPRFSELESYNYLIDELFTAGLMGYVWELAERITEGKNWHRFELLRCDDVRSSPKRIKLPTVLSIRDLGDHRILHYHETVDKNTETQSIAEPIRISLTGNSLANRYFTIDQEIIGDDPDAVNAFIIKNLRRTTQI